MPRSARPEAMRRTALAAVLLLVVGAANAQAPAGWTVDASLYPSSMSMVAAVSIDGVPIASLDAVLAAGTGSSIRGVATPTVVDGRVVFFLTVHGEGSDVLTFEVYTGVEGSSPVTLGPGLTFSPGAASGTPLAPVTLSNTSLVAPSGWTVDPALYSASSTLVASVRRGGLPVTHPDAVLAVFSGATIRGVARITLVGGAGYFFMTVYGDAPASLSFQVFDPASGGAPLAVGPDLSYAPGSASGSVAAPVSLVSETTSTPPTGWAVEPWTFASSMNLVVRVEPGGSGIVRSTSYLGVFSGTSIRGIATPTQVGADQLFFLTAFGDAAGPLTFRFADGTGSTIDVGPGTLFTPDGLLGTTAQPLVASAGAVITVPAAWMTLDPSAHPSSMSIVATVVEDGGDPAGSPGVLAAFAGRDLRGVATSQRLGNSYLYYLTVHGESAAAIRFEYATGAVSAEPVTLGPGVLYGSDIALGSTFKPFVLRPGGSGTQPDQVAIQVRSRWNMVGLPVTVGDAAAATVFPRSVPGSLFAFNGQYSSPDPAVLTAGQGYWLRFPAAEPILLSGSAVERLTLNLASGWNLISGPFCTLPVVAITDPGAVVESGSVFGFAGTYASASSLVPGKGYWIRASSAGSITLDCGAGKKAPEAGDSSPFADHSVIRFVDTGRVSTGGSSDTDHTDPPDSAMQQLLIGRETGSDYHLPPPAPGGAFRVSFDGDLYATGQLPVTARIENATGTVTIAWHDPSIAVEILFGSSPGGDAPSGFLPTGASPSGASGLSSVRRPNGAPAVMVTGAPETGGFTLKTAPGAIIRVSRVDSTVPSDLPILRAVYPNPMNTTATVPFDLQRSASVRLTVVDGLGRVVTTLVDGILPAGHHGARFDRGELSSGLYLLRLETDGINQTRPVLLLR